MAPRLREGFLEARRHGSLNQAHHRLSQLYSDTKQTYRSVSPPPKGDDAPALVALQQNFQTQKDRLIAWGLGWSDDRNSSQLRIDESVERAGLTEVVTTIMEKIQDLVSQVEKMRPQRANYAALPAHEKRMAPAVDLGYWSEKDKSQFEILVTELTSAIDILYDLTAWRRQQFGEGPTKADGGDSRTMSKAPMTDYSRDTQSVMRKALPLPPRTASSHASDSNAALHASSKIDISSLVLPEEPPPPYHNLHAAISSPRILGHAQRTSPNYLGGDSKISTVDVPVFVEYANYDPSYRSPGISPPLARLEEILRAFHSPGHLASSESLLALAGYFEDPNHSRYGLVYELPASAYLSAQGQSHEVIKTTSLLQLLQSSAKVQFASIPPLEQRFRLAFELAKALAVLQDNEISHRDVSSNNIIFFSKPSNAFPMGSNDNPRFDLRKPYVCSFDLFSEVGEDPFPEDALLPEDMLSNLYRHPQDPRYRGSSNNHQSAFRFDLYGLGLLLLEVGLWVPLSELFKQKYTLRDFRTRIKKLWIKRLADRCGTSYMRIVESCLDAGETSSIDVSHTYTNTVLRLRRLCAAHDEYIPTDDFAQHMTTGPDSSEAEQTWQIQSVEIENPMTGLPTNFEDSFSAPRQLEEKHGEKGVSKFEDRSDLKHRQHMTGKPKRARGKVFEYPGKEMPKSACEQWEEVGTRLSSIVAHALRHSRESSSVSLSCIGESEETAKPTLLVTCASTAHVRCALKRKKFFYDKETFDLVITKGSIIRSKAAKPKSRRPKRSAVNDSTAYTEPMNPFHQERPLCGASIGAFKDNEHLPPVSYGGIVKIDGALYGMSVHHLMEDPDDSDSEQPSEEVARASAPRRPSEFELGNEHESGFGDAYPARVEIEEDYYYDSDEEPEDMIDDMSDDDDDDDATELGSEEGNAGDREGIMVGEGEEIVITQPALDDVAEGFFPSEEDRDDDHLDSHSLGHIHASSGIRRWNRQGVTHEIDWALIKLRDQRVQPLNLVAGGKRFCPETKMELPTPLAEPVCRGGYQPAEDLYPLTIAQSESIGGLEVHCFGRTSGLQSGKISRMMDFVKFPGRKSFSKSWYAVGHFGIGGDSGAWVIDNRDGSICGHVLAWSASLQRAYIAPMDVLFEDIRSTLNAQSITLPGANIASFVRPAAMVRTDIYNADNAAIGFGDLHLTEPRMARSHTIGSAAQRPRSVEFGMYPPQPPQLDSYQLRSSTFDSDHYGSPGPKVPYGSMAKLEIIEPGSSSASSSSALGSMLTSGRRAAKEAAKAALRETRPALAAQHFLFSGAPGHLEREWSARRRALGERISG